MIRKFPTTTNSLRSHGYTSLIITTSDDAQTSQFVAISFNSHTLSGSEGYICPVDEILRLYMVIPLPRQTVGFIQLGMEDCVLNCYR